MNVGVRWDDVVRNVGVDSRLDVRAVCDARFGDGIGRLRVLGIRLRARGARSKRDDRTRSERYGAERVRPPDRHP